MIFHVGPGAPAGASWAHILPFTSLTEQRKVALLYCREVAVCPLLADGVKKAQQQSGYKIVTEAQVSLAQPDFTAEMIAARNAGADVVVTIADNATTVRVARSAHRQNYRPVVSTQQSANEDSFIALGGADVEGTLVAAVVPDYATSPKLADYRAAMTRHVPGGRRGSFSAQTWAAGKLLEAAAARFADTVRAADVLEGLYSLRNEDLGGLVPPMNFVRGEGHGGVNQCIIPARIEGGGFVYPHGDRFFCPPGFKPQGT
jgi:branched-chain amino acid transport system substrate-binding protein